jgi:hypothetical protein
MPKQRRPFPSLPPCPPFLSLSFPT